MTSRFCWVLVVIKKGIYMSRSVVSILVFSLALTASVTASERETANMRAPNLPKYQQECSACHIAYPPSMLPATSWARVMASLDKHYGTNASLDAVSVAELSRWLQAQAGKSERKSENPPQDRITKSAWFVREHDEVSSAVWKRIGSASNCVACHSGAASGNFGEHDVRIPK